MMPGLSGLSHQPIVYHGEIHVNHQGSIGESHEMHQDSMIPCINDHALHQ